MFSNVSRLPCQPNTPQKFFVCLFSLYSVWNLYFVFFVPQLCALLSFFALSSFTFLFVNRYIFHTVASVFLGFLWEYLEFVLELDFHFRVFPFVFDWPNADEWCTFIETELESLGRREACLYLINFGIFYGTVRTYAYFFCFPFIFHVYIVPQ